MTRLPEHIPIPDEVHNGNRRYQARLNHNYETLREVHIRMAIMERSILVDEGEPITKLEYNPYEDNETILMSLKHDFTHGKLKFKISTRFKTDDVAILLFEWVGKFHNKMHRGEKETLLEERGIYLGVCRILARAYEDDEALEEVHRAMHILQVEPLYPSSIPSFKP